MKLMFLGKAYETTSTEVAATPTAQLGKYRGASLKFSALQTSHRAKHQLT